MGGKRLEETSLLKRPDSFKNLISFANVMPLILCFLIVGAPEIVLASKGDAYEVKPVWREPRSYIMFFK